MNYKFKKETFNQKANPERRKKIHQNYTFDDVLKKLSLYEKTAKKGKEKNEIEKIKSSFQEKEEKRPGNQMSRYIQFEHSRKLAPPVKSWEEVEKQDKANTQAERNKVVRELKKYRHQNYSVSKNFMQVSDLAPDKTKE